MWIPCCPCGKKIREPNASNADYIIATDTVVREPVEVLIALKHNQATLDKVAKMKVGDIDGTSKIAELLINDNEYDAVEVESIKAAHQSIGEDLVKVVAEVREKDIQKTGIICPDCYKPTDSVIWGVHKPPQ